MRLKIVILNFTLVIKFVKQNNGICDLFIFFVLTCKNDFRRGGSCMSNRFETIYDLCYIEPGDLGES